MGHVDLFQMVGCLTFQICCGGRLLSNTSTRLHVELDKTSCTTISFINSPDNRQHDGPQEQAECDLALDHRPAALRSHRAREGHC